MKTTQAQKRAASLVAVSLPIDTVAGKLCKLELHRYGETLHLTIDASRTPTYRLAALVSEAIDEAKVRVAMDVEEGRVRIECDTTAETNAAVAACKTAMSRFA